ncbi:hypothetical protein E1262_07625 [Jiangella aurantiaca]|uniref:Uncharacterized protein n=1 Tax=Jiangella aurantiaca TaxID=2530373 RepID=A0A4R5AI27_9ACTN|nr:hypothetical protein [Jiangella aurantiaca]TDD70989.1 hypothetical protein E1262_07625 [Jiangella aurantiaca]
MTQQPAPPDRGAVRAAIEGLLRTCVDLEYQADGAATEARKRARGVAEALAAVRLPRGVLDVPALAQQVDDLGSQLDADLRGRLAEARRPYVTEIHTLLALLAPWHGLAALPPMASAAPVGDLHDHFPAGFAQNYIDDLLAAVDRSVTLTVQTAAGVPAQPHHASDQAKIRVSDRLSYNDRAEGVRMLQGSDCHAVERHGPHISREAQLARLLWRKDPAGQQRWQPLAAGGAESDHWCGPAAGGFTSPEAMAKPLQALLRWARDHATGLDELLNRHTKPKTKRVAIHVSAESAGLVAGDAAGYRGTATSNRAMTDDWLDAREYAMVHGAPPVYAVPYDPIVEGPDAGAFLQFKRVGPSSWQLVTCYPVGHRNPNSKRLEDLI